MNKKTAIKRFIFSIVLTILGIILAVWSFPIPGSTYDYQGFANAIKLGLDLKGGVVAVYNCEEIEGIEGSMDSKVDATIERLSDLLTSKGYTEATVTKQGNAQIRVEVPDVENTQALLNMVGEPAKLEFKKDNNGEAGDTMLTGSDLESVTEGRTQEGEYCIDLKFNSKASVTFAEMTREAYNNSNAPIYIYLDGTQLMAPKVQAVITDGKTQITGGYTQYTAKQMSLKILSGTYALKLSVDTCEKVSATLSDGAISKSLIAGVIGLLIMFLVMILLYRDLGLLASFAIVVNLVLMLFFLMAVPMVQLTLPAIAGVILSIGMAVDGSVIIFERIKEEYASGKRMHNAFNDGFKRSISAILDGQITTIIAAICLAIFGTGTIRGFAIVLLIGIVISLFTSLVVQRGLLQMYLAINSKNAKRAGLRREEIANEMGR